jgi:hypothetical protein
LDFSTNSYEFYKLADLCLERGAAFSHIGPWKVLNVRNWFPGRTTQGVRSIADQIPVRELTGGEGQVRGNAQGLMAVTWVVGVGERRGCSGVTRANRDGRQRSEGHRRRSGGWRAGGWRGGG